MGSQNQPKRPKDIGELMILIGLSGYARSGKDTAAEFLVEGAGFTRVSFADKLREFLYALNPMVEVVSEAPPMEFIDPIKLRAVRVREVIDTYGWDGYKDTRYVHEIRPLLQRLGTEAGRQTISDTIWIDAALNGLDPEGRYVVTDARFPNEAEAVKSRGGALWRIDRRDTGPALGPDGTAHPSETSLDDWDFDLRILNDSNLEELKYKVLYQMQEFRKTKEFVY